MIKETTGNESQQVKNEASNFLIEIIGNQVIVKLYNEVQYVGVLLSIDGYMNIVLEKCRELVYGKCTRDYENVFIRGNNVSNPQAESFKRITSYYKKLPVGPEPKHTPTNILQIYGEKYWKPGKETKYPILHFIALVILLGYYAEYNDHLKHHLDD